jgi:hypothetical protein
MFRQCEMSLMEYTNNLRSVLVPMTTKNIYEEYYLLEGARGSVVVKALSYKSEGRGIESR